MQTMLSVILQKSAAGFIIRGLLRTFEDLRGQQKIRESVAVFAERFSPEKSAVGLSRKFGDFRGNEF